MWLGGWGRKRAVLVGKMCPTEEKVSRDLVPGSKLPLWARLWDRELPPYFITHSRDITGSRLVR